MPRFLALDWDAQNLHLVCGDVGRKGVRVEQALTWPLPEELRPASAENLGRKLRDFLKDQGIAPAPVLACLGRERLILKDLHFPPVPTQEEPGLVRFQATKDLTDAPDAVILDYTHLKHPELTGERQAMAVIARRGLIHSLQDLCRGLGVKLMVATARAYGLAGALERARQHGALDEAGPHEQMAALAISERLAELCVVRGRQVLFARSPAVGPTLAGEVKRSLALYNAQNQSAGDGPQAVLVTGGPENELFRGTLQNVLTLPVRPLDPFGPQETGIGGQERGVYAAGIGLLHLWGVAGSFPINFLEPKKARPVGESEKRRNWFLGVGALVVVLGLLVFAYLQIDQQRKIVAEKMADKTALEETIKRMAQDRLDVDFLKDWDQGTVAWLDELHDLTAHFPREEGFRLNQLIAAVVQRKAIGKDKDKDRFVARIAMQGVGPAHQDTLVAQLADLINRDPHLRATVERFKGQGFELKVDVAPKTAATPALARPTAMPKSSAANGREGGFQ